jgi:glucokinase
MDLKVLGIDIGGTTTAFGIVGENGEVSFASNLPTKSFHSPEILVERIYQELSENNLLSEINGIGIGAPNGNFFSGNIEFAPNLKWEGVIPLVKLFEDKFKIKTCLTNDANAAAIGEMIFGVAKNMKDFISITLGTGVGSGIISNGKLIYGHDGFAGELGHIKVKDNGRLCGCGRYGCLEMYCSSTGVVRTFFELNSLNKNISSLQCEEKISAKSIFEHAQKGDVFANEIIDFTAQILGESLANFVCYTSPEAFILFGGYAQNESNFCKLVKHYMEENLLKIYKNKIKVLKSGLHDKNAAVLGAAALIMEKYNEK